MASLARTCSTKVERHAARTLARVCVVHRHGDRSPGIGACVEASSEAKEENSLWSGTLLSSSIINRLQQLHPVVSDHRNSPKGIPPYGSLTRRGFEQLAALGFSLKKAYGHLVDDQSSLHVQSSNYLRTHQSAQVVLSAFFAPINVNDHEGLEKHIQRAQASQGPVVHVRDEQHCVIDAFSRHYTKITTRVRGLIESDEFQAHEAEFGLKDVQARLAMLPCFAAGRQFQWYEAADILYCYSAHSELRAPQSVQPILADAERANDYLLWRFSKYYGDKKILCLACADLLEEILHALNACDGEMTEQGRCSLNIFSGHDVSIMPALIALGMWDGAWPFYASSLCFEAWERNSCANAPQVDVRVVYNGTVLGEISISELYSLVEQLRTS